MPSGPLPKRDHSRLQNWHENECVVCSGPRHKLPLHFITCGRLHLQSLSQCQHRAESWEEGLGLCLYEVWLPVPAQLSFLHVTSFHPSQTGRNQPSSQVVMGLTDKVCEEVRFTGGTPPFSSLLWPLSKKQGDWAVSCPWVIGQRSTDRVGTPVCTPFAKSHTLVCTFCLSKVAPHANLAAQWEGHSCSLPSVGMSLKSREDTLPVVDGFAHFAT
jgi:hypothetical protein